MADQKDMLTISGCCDNINITVGNTFVMFGKHKFAVSVTYCNHCGAVKSTSHIKEQK